jgi:hypothetical protein
MASALFAGCGVAFGDGRDGNEFFREIEVSGDMRAGAPLTVAISFAQYYAMPVVVRCELRQGGELVTMLGEATATHLPFGNPDATPFPGNFAWDFSVAEPGTYKVQCYTPLDEDNYVEEEFTIRPAPPTTPTPIVPTGGEFE